MNPEQKRFLNSLFFPVYFICLIWLCFITAHLAKLQAFKFGILPRTFSGLKGLIFSPLIHRDIEHIYSNSIPLLLLGTALFYFYRPVAVRTFLLIYFLSGLLTWIVGRSNFHIGASGIVYGLASFIFFSGIIRKHIGLMALSLLVVFLYGGMVWFVFPVKIDLSWEGHLSGGISGLALAIFFRKAGQQRPRYEWEEDDYNEDEQEHIHEEHNPNEPVIRYMYKEKDSDKTQTQ